MTAPARPLVLTRDGLRWSHPTTVTRGQAYGAVVWRVTCTCGASCADPLLSQALLWLEHDDTAAAARMGA